MLRSISIRNFRGFESLEVHGFKDVNLIVGQNAAGKTTLLEALYLCAGSGALAASLQLRAFRQMGANFKISGGDVLSYESLWEDLFFNSDLKRIIEIISVGDENDSRQMRVFNQHRTSQLLPFGESTQAATNNPQIVSEWTKNQDPPVEVRPTILPNGIVYNNVPFDHFPIMMFGPHINDTVEENANRFSQLSRTGKIEPVIDALRSEFEFIESLSLEFLSGSPSIFAKVKGREAKQALGLVSDGVHKLFSLLLGIAISEKGMVLVDQLEDGFYFQRFPKIWKAIFGFARINRCQLFITTHSKECIDGALPVLEENPESFSLLRAHRENGRPVINTVEGRYLKASLTQGFEIR